MRKIKFRAWDADDKKILEPWQLLIDGLGNIFVRTIKNGDVEPRDNVTLLQFTGLQDKDGDEIYEGYVVRHVQPSGGLLPPVDPENCEIRYENYGFHPFIIGSPYGSKVYMHSEKLEVIGNIYENPELLGGEVE